MKGQNIKNLHPFSYFINKRGIPRIVFFSKKLYAVACENSHETAANQHVSKAKTPTASQPKTSLGFHADYRGLKTLIEESCNFCETFSNLALKVG